MWTCPKCGRTFARNGQDHYCGKPPETIEEYILNQPEKAQPLLKEINETIRAAIPDTMEKISWSMPTYWKKRNLIQFAAFKNHVGLYPGPEAVEKIADRLTGYQTQKGTIRLPYDQPLDRELVAEIAVWCEKENGK